MLGQLNLRLKGKVVILGIGNTLRSDDGAGSILASRLKSRALGFKVFDAGSTPENYLGKIIREAPDTVVIIDAFDFGSKPGDFKELAQPDFQTVNLFSTHNTSLSLVINYLQSNFKTDIIILMIQPKTIIFGEKLSPEVGEALDRLEDWFYEAAKKG
jgi:hydrogenase 3 maturation protease